MAISVISSNSTGVGGATETSVTFSHGFTLAENDLLVAVLHVNQTGQSITDNNGSNPFTVDYDDFLSGATSTLTVCSRVCGASEPTSISWTWNNATHYSFCVYQIRGVNTSTPWDTTPAPGTTASTASGSSLTVSSITTSVDGCLGFVLGGSDANGTVTDLAVDNSYGNVVENYEKPLALWYKAQASAGALGDTIITPNTTADIVGVHGALQPGSINTTITVPTGPLR